MADETTQGTTGGQTNNQSSSQSQDQSQSTAAAGQAAGSATTQSSQAGTTNNQTSSQQTTQQQAAARPEWVPENFYDSEKHEIKGAEFRAQLDELATFKAAEDSRKLTLPQAPEAYQPVLPEGFTPPVGVDFKLDTKDPIIAQAQAMAHAKGWSQQDFSDALGVYATAKLNEAVIYENAKTAALAGLGTTGPARIDAVTRWLAANFPEGTVKPVLATMATQQHVEMFEKIISKLTNGGAGSFRQTGREVDTGKLSEEAYSKLSYGEKKAYAAKHSNGQTA